MLTLFYEKLEALWHSLQQDIHTDVGDDFSYEITVHVGDSPVFLPNWQATLFSPKKLIKLNISPCLQKQ